MFEELYQLARTGPLTLAISAGEQDNRMTVVVLPKPNGEAGEHALSTPLVLSASPAEFDAEFVGLLCGYRAQRRSLAEQAETTKELLAAAAEASSKRGSAAVAKAERNAAKSPNAPSPPVWSGVGKTESGDDDAVDQESGSDESTASADTQESNPAAVTTELTPNLFG